ncbi:MAG TPA: RIP metalloprotease RseP [Candidatus Paceibacterota bacterium]
MTIIIFILVLAILIFVHELGHFLTARACGIRVDEFALGFGTRLWQVKKGETTYALNLIPFGGYVKIFGENPDEESINGPDKARSFVNKPKWQQIAVLVAGVFFNFIFACILISSAFISGVPASIESYPKYADSMTNPRIVITYIEPNSPAEKAGLKAGDEIQNAGSIETLQKSISESRDKGIEIDYKRNDIDSRTTIIAKEGIVEGKYAIGIAMDKVSTLKLPIHLAFIESARFTLHMIKSVTVGIYDLIIGMFNGVSKLSSVTGPIGIAEMIGDASNLGFTYLMMFTALISINLGVLNLVPFPALDGGRILFVMIEAIIRRPIKPIVANSINAVGFGLLILLMIVVTYKDIVKLFVK